METINHIEETKQSNAIEGKRFWQNWYVKYQEYSGTRRSFCRVHELNYDRFQYWYNKLSKHKVQSKNLIPVKTNSQILPSSAVCTLVLSQGNELRIYDQDLAKSFLSRVL